MSVRITWCSTPKITEPNSSKEILVLSDANKLKNVSSGKKRPTTGVNNMHWSDSQKIEAVTTYLALGNLVLTSSVLKIPEFTLRAWKQKDWWKEIEQELAVQEDIQLSSRLKRIIETTISATEDRIKNGDWIYNNKEGCLMRKPVNLRDVHKVTMDMIDKREQIAGKTTVSLAVEAVDERLMKLAEKFAEIAQNKTKAPIEVIDVIVGEDVDANTDSTAS
jgi:hypothetical protein